VEVDALVGSRGLQCLEALGEALGGPPQGALGVDAVLAGEGGDGEQQVADLALDLRRRLTTCAAVSAVTPANTCG